MTASIDLNADLGEGFGRWTLGDDDALLSIVSSANVACGFHAGDPSIMRHVCDTAARNRVAIGAQVGYPDLAGFGRRFIDIDPGELRDGVLYQLGALDALARAVGASVTYVKPHGALYNAIVHHDDQAEAVVDAVASFRPGLAILGLPGSAVLRHAAAAGLAATVEAFVDRAYQADGSLVPRGRPGAVITEPAEVVARAVSLAVTGSVDAIDATPLSIVPRSLCLHGDTRGAAELAAAVRAALERAHITVEPFAR